MKDEKGNPLAGRLNVIFFDLVKIRRLINILVEKLSKLEKWGLTTRGESSIIYKSAARGSATKLENDTERRKTQGKKQSDSERVNHPSLRKRGGLWRVPKAEEGEGEKD